MFTARVKLMCQQNVWIKLMNNKKQEGIYQIQQSTLVHGWVELEVFNMNEYTHVYNVQFIMNNLKSDKFLKLSFNNQYLEKTIVVIMNLHAYMIVHKFVFR